MPGWEDLKREIGEIKLVGISASASRLKGRLSRTGNLGQKVGSERVSGPRVRKLNGAGKIFRHVNKFLLKDGTQTYQSSCYSFTLFSKTDILTCFYPS